MTMIMFGELMTCLFLLSYGVLIVSWIACSKLATKILRSDLVQSACFIIGMITATAFIIFFTTGSEQVFFALGVIWIACLIGFGAIGLIAMIFKLRRMVERKRGL